MGIDVIKEKISPILAGYGVEYAGLFGSVSRGEDTEKSDVDILVRLGRPMGMISYMGLIREIEEKLGRKVDLVTEKGLNKFIRPYIIKDLKTIYEK